MTTQENIKLIRNSVEEIKTTSADDEAAHCHEDSLWEAVLKDIAKGAPDAHLLAQEALKTKEIKFARWCA